MEEFSATKHIPVLVNEVVTFINPQPHHVYLDVTFGSGGHTQAILKKEPTCSVIALDWDQRSLDTYFPPLKKEFGDRISCIWGNFAHLYKLLKKEKIKTVHGILADFGTSYMHIFDRSGFSFYKDTVLDMRMSPAHYSVTAADIIRDADEKTLSSLFWDFGQEKHARRIARAIIEARSQRPITTTHALASLIEKCVPWSKKGIHPATKVFQALRIVVNDEMANIRAFLAGAYQAVDHGGRIVCISFHSDEDRLVKDFFREQERKGHGKILTKKVVTASAHELQCNPSSRSARLRAFEIIKDNFCDFIYTGKIKNN